MAHRKHYTSQLPKAAQEPEDRERPSCQHRDYIRLRVQGPAKIKESEKEVSVLEQITTDKYRSYYAELDSGVAMPLAVDADQSKALSESVRNGRNVCVFGFGSKVDLLRRLLKQQLCSYKVIEVTGYLPSINEKKVYNHFGNFLMDVDKSVSVQKTSIKDQRDEYEWILSKLSLPRLVVLFHSLDGPSFLNPDAQRKLSDLFMLPKVQLICTVDSLKIVACWSLITLEKYKFVFFHVLTRQLYLEEQRHRPMDDEKKENSEESLKNIWQGLNANQKQILKFIAKNELDNLQRDQPKHFTFNQLLEKCIDEIILSNDNQLRVNLLDLIDHYVIAEDETKNKKQYIINYEKKLLEKIIEDKLV